MDVWIREAEAPDVPSVVELGSALFQEDAGTRDPYVNQEWPEKEGCEYFADFLSRPGTSCLLAGSSGLIVGYLAGYIKERSSLRPVKVAELESVYVREAYRGRGVGMELARKFFSWAESGSVERISVTAYASNGQAIRFYERLGFRPKSLTLEAESPG